MLSAPYSNVYPHLTSFLHVLGAADGTWCVGPIVVEKIGNITVII